MTTTIVTITFKTDGNTGRSAVNIGSMSLETTTMSVHKAVNKVLSRQSVVMPGRLLTISLVVVSWGLFCRPAAAKKTVGEVLQNIEKQKSSTALPNVPEASAGPREDLLAIKPPSRSTLYYQEGTDDAELERAVNQGIQQLYKLTQQFRTSRRRGELWLRLAEQYVEKARLIEYHLQSKFDQQVQAFNAGKLKQKPKINLHAAQEYNRKAIQLYEWFLRDFPKDPKIDQCLFFLGYNYFELGDPAKGKKNYERLAAEYPSSPFVDESNFALGEYYFENEKWETALGYYEKPGRNRRGRLYSFALYKIAWSQYKLGRTVKALENLELVIRAGKSPKEDEDASGNGVSRIRLATEATRDLVIFYAEAGNYKEAQDYFEKVAGPKNAFAMTEKLAYYYADQGNKEAATYVFHQLIDNKPLAPKAFDYQYQIVTMYGAVGANAKFREELFAWIQSYGPESSWAKSNSSSKELMAKSTALIETTLRNHILRQHQTAQNSHSPDAQKYAREGYQLYFDTFSKSSHIDEMHFFYGELLYDMKDFDRAAEQYGWVIENAPKSKYYEKSIVNCILAIERRLPKPEEVKQIVGDSTDPVEFTDTIKAFEKAALRYFQVVKKAPDVVAIKYRMASLYYYFNQFDKAIPLFKEIIREYPKSQYAEYSANLLLDTYNLKKDYAGLEDSAQDILKIPELRNSKVGDQVRTILQRTNFKKAEEFEKGKDFAKSAAAYEDFGRKNSGTDLGVTAFYNAGLNYEKAGSLDKASAMYVMVVSSKNASSAALRKNSSKFLAALYEKIGMYAKAAAAFEQYAKENPKDKEASDFYFNAAVIEDGLNNSTEALANYQKYFDTSRKSDRSEAVFLMAKVNERRKSYGLAVNYYKQYLDLNPRDPEEVIEATFQIAKLSEQLNRAKQADEYYGKTIAVQRRLAQKTENVGASYAAEARFKQVYKTFETLRGIRIPEGPKQAKAVQEKLNYLNRLKDEMKSVIKYDDGGQIVAGLTTMGRAYQHLAASLYNAPVPKGLDGDGLKAYREGIDKIAKPFAFEAENSYAAAIEKSQKLEAYNENVIVAARELAALKPEKYHSYNERAILSKIPDPLEPQDDDQRKIRDALASGSETTLLDATSKVLGHDPVNLYALNALAIHYLGREKMGLAQIIINRALKDHENEPSLHNNLGVIFLSEGNQRKAITSFKKAISIKNEYVIASTNLASLYIEYQDYGRALPPLESGYGYVKSDISKGNKDAIAVANNYAIALSNNGDNKKAEGIYKDLLSANARNSTVLLNYAILLIEKMKVRKEGRNILNKFRFVTSDPESERLANELDEKLKGLPE
jgi:tetratricopeptide (TPR) repeat protein